MKRSAEILGALLVGMLSVAGCGGGPTQPNGGGGGGGGSADADISGAWNGTITDRIGPCHPENFSLVLTQSAVDVNGFQGGKAVGNFSTPCGGQFSLQLYVKGNHLLGNVGGKGHVDGTVSGSSIEFAIIAGQGGLDAGQTIVAVVAMTR
jgi:hypothetical protein